jgi:Na+-translocating ferredoxin:NAD+ oxidoreductase subunit B
MEKDIYRQMQERLDSYSVGFPATESGVELEILKKLFSEDEAELFLALSPTLEKPEDIAARLDRPVEELAEKLEDMASRGLLFRLNKNGVKKYGATAFIHGIFEFQLPRIDRELVELVNRYLDEGMDKSMIGVKGTFLRTIPIAQSIPAEHHVASFDDAAEILRGAGKIVVADCICRKSKELVNDSCGAPLEVCFLFGSMGQYYLDNKMGREVDVDEAIKIVAKAQDAGLVTQPATSANPSGMCNCCGDCCGVLASIKRAENPGELVYSNNFARVDVDQCVECGECVTHCHMAAIVMSDEGPAVILEHRCIGCGVCIPRCPSEAISLHLKPEEKRQPLPQNSFEQMMKMMESEASNQM